MSDEAFWTEARRQVCIDPVKINLNAGTLSPGLKPAMAAADELRRRMATNPSDFVWRQFQPLLEGSRARLADYLRCDRADLLLLPNSTFGINLVTSSLKLKPGSEILTTDHEYGAMMQAWKSLAKRQGLVVRELQLPYRSEDPGEIVNAFDRAVGEQTRVMFFSHVTCTAGLVLPARQICELARKRGILSVIDGAHAPGMVPLDLEQIRADFYAGNCHKWLMAPAAAGFMHVARHRRSMLSPLLLSWGHDYDAARPDDPSRLGGTNWQADFEFHGTADRCPQMVLPTCLDFRDSLGGDGAILRRTWQLSSYTRDALATCGLACATPRSESLQGGALTAFDFPCDDVIAMRDRLWNEFDIECPITQGGGKTFLRVSTGWFNTTEEIDRLADAVRIITGRG